MGKAIKKKLIKYVLLPALPVICWLLIIILVLFAAFSIVAGYEQDQINSHALPAAVEARREMVTEIVTEYGINEYVNVLLCIMAAESGGEGTDPMGATRLSYNTKYPFGIKKVRYSIECAVQYVRDIVNLLGRPSPSDMDLMQLVVEGYYLGLDYIRWVLDNPPYKPEATAGYYGTYILRIGGVAVWNRTETVKETMLYYKHILYTVTVDSVGGGTGTGIYVWPCPTVPFVYRGFTGAGGHRGLDISGPVGSTIVASDSGTVVVSGWHDVTERSYGYYIKIDHGNGIATLYAHCSQLLVSAGEPVVAGQPIALMGSTGNSTGPHLHFEVLVSGSPVDPYGFVTKPG